MRVEDISNCLGHGEIKHSDILFTFWQLYLELNKGGQGVGCPLQLFSGIGYSGIQRIICALPSSVSSFLLFLFMYFSNFWNSL